MKAIFNFFSHLVKYIKLDYQLRKAVKLADRLHRETREVQFVLPDVKGNLIVLSKHQYRKMYLRNQANKVKDKDLYVECFYCTRWKNMQRLTNIGIRAKRKMYFEYYMR